MQKINIPGPTAILLAALTVSHTPLAHGALLREVFNAIPGATLADLTNHAHFPNQPEATNQVTTFESPPDAGDDYGVRLSGFVVPTISANYKFYLCGNGQAALFLSLDEHPEHKRLIAFEPVGNGSREWVNGTNQASRGNPPQNISVAIPLAAKQAYYVEALMKAGAGDDNLGVTWQRIGTAAPANGAAPIASGFLALAPSTNSLPTTGEFVPELAAFDYEVLKYMQRWNIRTTTLGVMKDGRLVLKRGYGWHDRGRTQPVQPDARMRIASITKTMTASAMKQFIARGLISTNTTAFPFLGIQPYNGRWGDSRLTNIVIGQLLVHQGGWNRDVVPDPVDQFIEISTTLGLDHPATANEFLTHQLSQPLQFAPGTANAYANIGYLTLGRVIEKLSGQSIESVVRREVFRPWGVKHIQPGRQSEKLREPDEPFYDDDTLTLDVQAFPSTDMVRAPDGGYANWDAFRAVGSMIASVEDLLHHAQGFHLSYESIEEVAQFGGNYVGPKYASIGEPRLTRKGTSSRHSGGWSGTAAFLDQRPDGVDWAILLNKSSSGDYAELLGIADRAIINITNWPGDNSTRIELASDSFTVDENEGNLVIGVRRTGWSTGEVSAVWTTLGGSALAGSDFTSVTGLVTFADNECAKRITIPILNDAELEANESFTVMLSDPTGGALLGLATATVTIRDDDTPRSPPSVQIIAPGDGTNSPTGTNVAIRAVVSDSDGSIYTVTYWAGPTLLGEENKPPYTFTWKKPGPGTYALTARAIDNDGLISTSAPVTLNVGPALAANSPGTLRRDVWLRRPTIALAGLTNYAFYPNTPTATEYLELFETTSNWGDYYGTRLRGWLYPPVTGSYVFWIAADARAELWLSTDEHPDHRQLIAWMTITSPPRGWTQHPSQQSVPIQLVAGQRYYVEALHKEDIVNDHLSVGWQLPDGTLERPVPGMRLSPMPVPLIDLVQFNGPSPQGFGLTLFGERGQRYVIEASTNLIDWITLTTLTNATGPQSFLDLGATNLTQRFYRARQMP